MPLKQLLHFLLLVLVVGFGTRPAAAQQPRRLYPEQRYGFQCATDSMQQAAWRRNPGAEQAYYAFLRQTAMLSATEQARILAQPDVTIPVVVHIIHTGTANNISDAQVNDAIRILNEDYSKTNPDTSSVIAAFQPIYANVGFRFRLAKKDPDGNCTTGITRTYSTLTSSAGDNVKQLINWDANRYLNIWVVDNIPGSGGYAHLPCAPSSIDGIVIRNTQFASIGRSCGSNFCKRSLTHEVGHHFGLPHTWGASNTPGDASNCGIDDGIADTPNTSGVPNQSCNLNYSPCGVLSNVQNYMDYSTCALMFTTGQKTVMRASLLLTCRATLVSAANLLDTGTNDGYQAVPCAPVAAFQNNTSSVCEGGSITFTDYSYNYTYNAATTQFDWRFAGGQPATSTQRNPTVTYSAAGIYDVTLIVITPAGRDTLTLAQLVRVQNATSGLQGSVTESFENADFPLTNVTTPIRNWQISTSLPGGQGFSWERGTGVASNGSAFLQVLNNYLPAGTESTLTSPNIDLSAITGTATLLFDRAHALRTAISNDQLQISYSTNCGATWLPLQTYNSTALSTRGTNPQIGFVPTTAADWQMLSLPLPATVQRATRFQLRLVDVSSGGNPLYIDNLRILDPLGTQDAEMARRGISVYPNPMTAETAVHFTLTGTERAQVRLTDVLGREVSRTAAKTYGAGTQSIRLQGAGGAALPAGIYLVQLTLGDQTFTTKVLVQ